MNTSALVFCAALIVVAVMVVSLVTGCTQAVCEVELHPISSHCVPWRD